MKESAKSREAFLSELRRHLHRLPQEEIDSAVSYYEEYLNDAGEEQLEQTLKTLGNPREVAASIQATRTLEEMEKGPPSAKKGMSAVWVVILSIFAAPIALPLAIAFAVIVIALAIAVFAVIVSLCAAVFAVIMTFGAVSLGLVLGGVFFACLSIPLFFQHAATGFLFLGSGIAFSGVGLLFLPGTVLLAKYSWKAAVQLFGHRFPRAVSKLRARRKEQ